MTQECDLAPHTQQSSTKVSLAAHRYQHHPLCLLGLFANNSCHCQAIQVRIPSNSLESEASPPKAVKFH